MRGPRPPPKHALQHSRNLQRPGTRAANTYLRPTRGCTAFPHKKRVIHHTPNDTSTNTLQIDLMVICPPSKSNPWTLRILVALPSSRPSPTVGRVALRPPTLLEPAIPIAATPPVLWEVRSR